LISLDPTNRIWMSDMVQYMEPVHIGQPMRSAVVLYVVEESHNPKYPVSSHWTAVGPWQSHAIVSDQQDPNILFLTQLNLIPNLPLDSYLSVFSFVIGCTAYVGLGLANSKPGETLVVSAAAGAVGSLVGQIGKIRGLHVIGIAGSEDKCNWVKNELGFDEVINYKKTPNIEKELEKLCPKGIDIYFDNVGGNVLDAALNNMALFSRIIVCGLISSYNDTKTEGPANFGRVLMKRVTIKGFIVTDHVDQFQQALSDLGKWLGEGKIKYRSDIVEGIENAQTALKKLYDGTNNGKLIVRVSH